MDKHLTILHLDDHIVYARGMKIMVRDIYFPNSCWVHFLHPDHALSFIESRFAVKESISLIITDISHPGLNGYEFAKTVRNIESNYNSVPIPIIAVTMHGENSPIVQKALQEELFEKYFTKNVEGEVLGPFIKELFEISNH